jgi:hypothetical protein
VAVPVVVGAAHPAAELSSITASRQIDITNVKFFMYFSFRRMSGVGDNTF